MEKENITFIIVGKESTTKIIFKNLNLIERTILKRIMKKKKIKVINEIHNFNKLLKEGNSGGIITYDLGENNKKK